MLLRADSATLSSFAWRELGVSLESSYSVSVECAERINQGQAGPVTRHGFPQYVMALETLEPNISSWGRGVATAVVADKICPARASRPTASTLVEGASRLGRYKLPCTTSSRSFPPPPSPDASLSPHLPLLGTLHDPTHLSRPSPPSVDFFHTTRLSTTQLPREPSHREPPFRHAIHEELYTDTSE